MRPISILVDSTSDLTADYRARYGLDFIHSHISVPGLGDIPAPVEWKELDREAFFADLKRRPAAYTTSPPNIGEFAEVFRKNAREGKDTIALTLSSTISGEFNFLCKGAEQVREEYPDCRIGCIDSRRFGPVIGLMAIYAAGLREKGLSFDEIVAALEENKCRFRQAGWLDDLSFVAKKGRISHAKAFFGTLAGVKPIGEFGPDGLTAVLGKASGAAAAYEIMLSYLEETIENSAERDIFIAHSQRLPQAEKYKQMIEERIHPRSVTIHEIYPINAINIGPGLMAAYYMGKPISADLSEEKALFARLQSGIAGK